MRRVKPAHAAYGIGGASVLSTGLFWYYSVCAWMGASAQAKLSLSSTLASGSLALAGIILVLLGLAFGMRDPGQFDRRTYIGSVLIFFLAVPLSLISSYGALIFGLGQQEPFLLLSLSFLFTTSIVLIVGATFLVARQT